MTTPSAIDAAPDRAARISAVTRRFGRGARWQPLEYLFWCLPVAAYFLFPGNYLLLSQIAITSLFALSLDLIFGYADIISLGHAAFFGVGAYTVGLLGVRGVGDLCWAWRWRRCWRPCSGFSAVSCCCAAPSWRA